MNQELLEWSKRYVPKFNVLSEKYQTAYYTQSPLTDVETPIDVMFVGINPKGETKTGQTIMTPEEFLAGNSCWEDRFQGNECKWQFNNGARFFLGYDRYRHSESIDNDKKVVWTNLSPFGSSKGFNDLPQELRIASLDSLFDLIQKLQPKKIVFLGGNAFSVLEKYASSENKNSIQHLKVFENQHLEIGRICNIPAVYVSHPSRHWAVNGGHCFIPVFIFLHGLIDLVKEGKPTRSLKEVQKLMRHELQVWKDQVVVNKQNSFK